MTEGPKTVKTKATLWELRSKVVNSTKAMRVRPPVRDR